jgi:hypothetical protein
MAYPDFVIFQVLFSKVGGIQNVERWSGTVRLEGHNATQGEWGDRLTILGGCALAFIVSSSLDLDALALETGRPRGWKEFARHGFSGHEFFGHDMRYGTGRPVNRLS